MGSDEHKCGIITSNVTNDVHHEKTDLKVFVVVIPKEELAGSQPRQSFFGYDTECKILLYCLLRLYSVVTVTVVAVG